MCDSKAIFPEFVPNQVLTDAHLNQLRDYLDQQEHLTRIRLVGTGIVCGLAFNLTATQVSIREGFGVTSDGYLIGIPNTTYTHFCSPYGDPDVKEDKVTPFYPPWQKPGGQGQIDIVELFDSTTASCPRLKKTPDPITSDTAKGRVLVLYLQREPVDLNTCIVTDCNNKGRNINLSVRALLVRKDDLHPVAEAHRLPMPARVPRLHTAVRLADVEKVESLNRAYAELVLKSMERILEMIRRMFDQYADFLDVRVKIAERLEPFVKWIRELADRGQLNQYHYDLLKDIAAAYSEAAKGACEIVDPCCPVRDFPRHLMLGACDGSAGYRNEFLPSPVRNVMGGDLERVRKLFYRVGLLLEPPKLEKELRIQITPSHAELHPLGRRAIPHYLPQFSTEAGQEIWQSGSECASGPIWSYYGDPEDIDSDYGICSFLRIEGQLGKKADEAWHGIDELRRKHNLEFNLIRAYLGDPGRQEYDLWKELQAQLAKEQELATQLIAAMSDAAKAGLKDQAIGKVIKVAIEYRRLRRSLAEGGQKFQQIRCGRDLYCDQTAIEADYQQLRSSLLCNLNELAGRLPRIVDACRALASGASGLATAIGIRENLLRQFAILLTLKGDPEKEGKDQFGQLKVLLGQGNPAGELVASVFFTSQILLERIAQFEEAEILPRRICGFNYPVFINRYKEIVADAVLLRVLLRVVELVFQGGAIGVITHLVPAGSAGGAEVAVLEEPDTVASLLGLLRNCAFTRMAAIASVYETVRRGDPSTFQTLARQVPGLEHLAGVGKSGTFVLLCELAQDDRVVADFSLAGPVPCCCRVNPDQVCLPPVALPDYRVVILERDEKGFKPVYLDVLTSDFDPNSRGEKVPATRSLRIKLEDKISELGADLSITEEGRICYQASEGISGIDRFSYSVYATEGHTEDITCPDHDSAAVVLLVLSPDQKGIVRVQVSDGKRPIANAAVTIRRGKAVSQEKTTDAAGEASFEDIAPGSYTMGASKAGYSSTAADIEVPSGGVLDRKFVLRARDFAVMPDTVRWVAEKKGVAPEEAEDLVGSSYAERYASRYAVLTEAAKFPKIAELQSYQAAETFLSDTATKADIADAQLGATYRESASSLAAGIKRARADTRAVLQRLLVATTLAMMDRLSLHNPVELGPDAQKVLKEAAVLLARVELKPGDVAAEWDGAGLTRDLGLSSPAAVMELFR